MGRLDNKTTATTTSRGRLPRATTTPAVPTQKAPSTGNFITNAPSNVAALFRGEVGVGDVVKEMPGVAKRGAIKTAETVAPAITNYTKTVGGIFGEGLAYATDKNVREQYKAGNLDILPYITKTTKKGLLKDTVAAALETTIIRSVPKAMTGKLATRAGIGGLEGIGFAISEGLAKDQTADEIIENAKLYGVSGAALNVALPWLGPLLQKEIGRAPATLKTALKEEARRLEVSSITPDSSPVDVSTPNKRHARYAEGQGYEPLISADEIPTIQGGPNINKELPHLPEGRTEAVFDIDNLPPPKVSSPARPKTKVEIEEEYLRSQGYEPYRPDNELPVIQMGKTTPQATSELPVIDFGGGRSKVPPPPGTRLVPIKEETAPGKSITRSKGAATTQQSDELVDIDYVYDVKTPQRSQVDIATKKPKIVSIKDDLGETKTYIKVGDVAGKSVQKVQGEQIPIGGPTKGASRLEARLVAQTEDPAYQAGVSNYRKYANEADAPEITGSANAEQIRRGAQAVEPLSSSEINAIVSGTAELPPGVLRTSFIKAASEKAILEGDSSLVNRLARAVGQAARRFGQEIQFTKNFDPLDPVTNIADILSVRLKAVERRLPKGETVSSYTKRNLTKARSEVTTNQIKIKEAESLIDSILCK